MDKRITTGISSDLRDSVTAFEALQFVHSSFGNKGGAWYEALAGFQDIGKLLDIFPGYSEDEQFYEQNYKDGESDGE